MKDNKFIGLMVLIGVGTIAAVTVLAFPHQDRLPNRTYEGAHSPSFNPIRPDCARSPSKSADPKSLAAHAYDCSVAVEEYRLKVNDLVQQTRAADAAQAQVEQGSKDILLNFVQTIGGILTLIAAFAAAKFARDAAIETRRGADAAHDDLNHSKLMSKIQLRAHLSISEVSFEYQEFDSVKNEHKYLLTTAIKNFGQTGGHSIKEKTGWTMLDISRCHVLESQNVDERHGFAPSDSVISTYQMVMSAKKKSDFDLGECSIKFYGNLEFTDAFNDINSVDYYVEIQSSRVMEYYTMPAIINGDGHRL